MARMVHWWIGDLLVYGEARWGSMYDEMIEHTGYDCRTLRTIKWVASRIEAPRRRDDLTFAHHQEVAALPPERQDAILARAAREGWTREMVRHAVNRLAYEVDRPEVTVLPGLHHGDCQEVMATLPDESVDLLLTAPPLDSSVPLDAVLALAATKLKPNSHAYVVGTWQTYEAVANAVERYFDLTNTLTWVTGGGEHEGGRDNYGDAYRVILFGHKGRRHLNGRREGDVLRYDRPGAVFGHLIEKSTQPGETVLDPFMATGDVCLAARDARRGYVGIESDRGRYDKAVIRLA
jgi:hypothetical protein